MGFYLQVLILFVLFCFCFFCCFFVLICFVVVVFFLSSSMTWSYNLCYLSGPLDVWMLLVFHAPCPERRKRPSDDSQ